MSGFAIYEEGSVDDGYPGKIVVVAGAVRCVGDGRTVHERCRNAGAVVLPPELVRSGKAIGTSTDQGPVLLTRSTGYPLEDVVQTIVECFSAWRTSDHGAEAAVRRQESALLLLLNGAGDTAASAAVLGLRPDRDHVVVAAAVGDDREERYRLAVSAEFPAERSVTSEGVTLSLIPVEPGLGSGTVAQRLRARLGRAIQTGEDLPVGVGETTPGVFTLQESAASAREALRALRFKLGVPWKAGAGVLRVATAEDIPDALALIRAGDALRSQGATLARPLLTLADHDLSHGSGLLSSVLAALEYRGNMTAAAKQLGIHANSLRARLERARDVSGVNLDDPVCALRAIVGFLVSPEAHNIARGSR